MRLSCGSRSAVSLAALALLGVACAHVPTAEERAKAARPEKVFVTGSRIAQRLDPRSGEPQTSSPLRVYSREQLLGTGRQGDLQQALRTLDPALGP